jgi:hypothetical protein
VTELLYSPPYKVRIFAPLPLSWFCPPYGYFSIIEIEGILTVSRRFYIVSQHTVLAFTTGLWLPAEPPGSRFALPSLGYSVMVSGHPQEGKLLSSEAAQLHYF